MPLRKGALTRRAILEHATTLASQVGLEGLTIGRLAEDLHLSKSGLFAHFKSKETLQIEVLDFASARFIDVVVRPTLATPRGERRVRAAFENWVRWPERSNLRGGCIFVTAAVEFDDRPGRVRDRLVELQKDWLETIGNTVRTAIAEGHFRKDVDPTQFGHDLYAVMLGYYHFSRLLRDPEAKARARRSFEALIAAARP